MAEPRIRPYAPADLGAVYDVCLQTGNAGEDASHLFDDPQLLGHLYVGPYVTLEADLAFVLEDDEGVCGYVLGALDTHDFLRRCRDAWFPSLQARYDDPTGDPATWSETQRIEHQIHHPSLDHPRQLEPYPSHLHIDLLPRAQGSGNGRRMMERLLVALREHGSMGVCLGVSPRNGRAIGFYRKLGFVDVPGTGDDDVLYMAQALTTMP